MQASVPQLCCRGIPRLGQRRQLVPSPILRVENKAIRDARMTLRPELATGRVNVPGIVARNAEVCLRHVGWRRKPIRPPPAVQVKYIDRVDDGIERVIAADEIT